MPSIKKRERGIRMKLKAEKVGKCGFNGFWLAESRPRFWAN
jgi:hypothetical protein